MLFMRNDSVHKMGVSGEIEIFSQEVQKKKKKHQNERMQEYVYVEWYLGHKCRIWKSSDQRSKNHRKEVEFFHFAESGMFDFDDECSPRFVEKEKCFWEETNGIGASVKQRKLFSLHIHPNGQSKPEVDSSFQV